MTEHCSSRTWLESVDLSCDPLLWPQPSAVQPSKPPRAAPAAPPSPAQTSRSSAAIPRKTPRAKPISLPTRPNSSLRCVDQLLKFSSDETGLPIKSDVKRQLTTRAAVESYLTRKVQ